MAPIWLPAPRLALELIEAGHITCATIGTRLDFRKSIASAFADAEVNATQNEAGPRRPGDLQRDCNGRLLTRRVDLMRALRRDVIARVVPLVIERDGKVQKVATVPKWRPVR